MATRKKGQNPTPSEDELTPEEHEAIARKRTAWGQFAAFARMTTYDRDLTTYDTHIRKATNEEDRKRAETAREEFVNRAKRSTQLYIG